MEWAFLITLLSVLLTAVYHTNEMQKLGKHFQLLSKNNLECKCTSRSAQRNPANQTCVNFIIFSKSFSREVHDTKALEISLYWVSVFLRLRIAFNLCHTVMVDGHLPVLDRSQGSRWLFEMSSVLGFHLNAFNLRVWVCQLPWWVLIFRHIWSPLQGLVKPAWSGIARNIFIFIHIYIKYIYVYVYEHKMLMQLIKGNCDILWHVDTMPLKWNVCQTPAALCALLPGSTARTEIRGMHSRKAAVWHAFISTSLCHTEHKTL